MIELFKRHRLQRKGMSCGRKRRERELTDLQDFLRNSPVITGVLLALAALSFGGLVFYQPALGAPFVDEPVKALLVTMLIFLVGVLELSVTLPRVFNQNGRLCLLLGTILLHLGLAKAVLNYVEFNYVDSSDMVGDFEMLLVPCVFAPMIITVLLGRAPALFATLFVSVWGCLLVSTDRLMPWLLTSLVTGFVAIAATHGIRKRKHFLRAGLFTGLTAFALAMLFGYVQALRIDDWAEIDWKLSLWEALVVIAVNMVIGLVVSGVIPMLEGIFRITTESSWLELADLNHPLLRRLTLEAPGTYHHSLLVANLAEAAAESIGANALMTRVCAYFHDIGKLNNPEYFIENQPVDENPHDRMAPSMSALVVIAHVKDGIDLALKHKLNCELIDVIEQHHGTSLVWYFYKRALDKQQELRVLAEEDKVHETDVPDVDANSFRYPGPKPQFKESAIISLADSIESASRTLEKPTPQKIEQLVEDIVRSRINDGQLDECDLTFGELRQVKKSFVSTLRSMLHKRVAYSRSDEGETKTETNETPRTQRLVAGQMRFEVLRKPGDKPAEPKTSRERAA